MTYMRRVFSSEDLEGQTDILVSNSPSFISIASNSFTSDDDALPSSPTRRLSDEARKHTEDLEKRAKSRQMNGSQEVWNAITMLAPPACGLFFISSGLWVTEDAILQAKEMLLGEAEDLLTFLHHFEGEGRCIDSPYFSRIHAMPPLATISIVMGYLFHAPCSICYHLLCAFKLPPGKMRLDHWSRRLDQSMIYIMSVCTSYGTSGSRQYALASMLFSIDSIYRLYQPIHRPRSILLRMILAFSMPVLPAIVYGYYEEAMQFIIIFALSGWIFAAYPFGGYSHSIFHLIAALSNPIQLTLSTKLLTSEEAIQTAAICAVVAQALES